MRYGRISNSFVLFTVRHCRRQCLLALPSAFSKDRVETTLLQQFAREIRVSHCANRVALEKSVAIINH